MSAAAGADVRVEDAGRRCGRVDALRNANLHVRPGELADERAGAVDSETGQRVLEAISEVRARRGMTVIIVSYDAQVGSRADRAVMVTDGVLDDGDPSPTMSATTVIREPAWSAPDAARCL